MKDGKSVRTTTERPQEWLTCQSIEEWRSWLSRHHEDEAGTWLKIRKVKSLDDGVLLDEAVIEALRFGWIDGKMYSLGEKGMIVRFTPRRRGSIWSARNRRRAEVLIQEGRMLEPGMAAIRAAMENGKWDEAFLEAEKRQASRGMETGGEGKTKLAEPDWAELENGIRLHYIETGNLDGIPIILLPGIADSCHVFDLLLPHLPDDLHVIALSPRGHGDSDAPQSGYRTIDFAMDLKQFMDAVGLEKAVILGASSGGFVARRFADTWPERTLGLVLLGAPAMLADKPSVRKAWDEVISKLADPIDPDFIRGFAKEETQERVPLEFREMLIEENLKVPARVWVQTTEGLLKETFPDDLKRIQCPALILWGDTVTITTQAEQEGVKGEIRDARLVVLEGLGHMLYWEGPEQVAKEIGTFVHEIGG